MLKITFTSLYVLSLLSFCAMAIESLAPYTGVLLQLFLHGLGLGLLLNAIHGHLTGVLVTAPHTPTRESGGLIFNVILVLMVLLGLGMEGIGLLFLAFG